MSFHPNDLVNDVDLRDYEDAILATFGQTSWQAKRTKALEDWLFPILKGQGFDPQKLRTRSEPSAVQSYTGAAFTDRLAAATDTTDDDLNLAAIFATPSADALYVGFSAPFRGLFVRMLDTPSTAAGVLAVAYWNGNWESLAIADGTIQTAGKTMSGGGSVAWLLPVDWQTRKVNSVGPYYWIKVTVSAVPTSAKAGQLGVISGSCLRAPATFRTLQLIFREAPTGGDGPWEEKAEFYRGEADAALQRALAICGSDFDTDASDEISAAEAAQTSAEVGGGWTLERG